ncbi:MAG: L-ribulose-5-phosphate 4-epimerase [Clostridiales bacterium]|nr:L-ribulose-5-phosphate 4-epimerase [Clostridiales bacterium]
MENLKERVCSANLELFHRGIVIYTWGNVSAIDRQTGLVVIKPSGIGYDSMTPEDMVVVSLETGEVVEGKWRPSSDTPTHIELYRAFKEIGGITHSHSINAVAFAQAARPIPALGTTHADYFYGDIPCTRGLAQEEIETAYEKNTGKVIVETLSEIKNALEIPGILVKNHGPFSWGASAEEAIYHAVVMEAVAEMALKTLQLNPSASMDQFILDKHYFRKHGEHSYYGQR